LRVLEGLECEEVAEATGLRAGTVRTQVMKARKLLARWLAPWIADDGDKERRDA
jgi:DNA-directed RNA polymerase specialized sigma24 family protein